MDIDPRGARFGAMISAIVLALVLVTGSVWLLAAQALVFAASAGLGLRYAPYGLIFRWLIRPRLGSPAELEPAAPPRFAQGVGAVFSLVGVIGYATGVTPLGLAATAAALAAAFLNAAFGFCLGCEMYLLIQRLNLFHPHQDHQPTQGLGGPDEKGSIRPGDRRVLPAGPDSAA